MAFFNLSLLQTHNAYDLRAELATLGADSMLLRDPKVAEASNAIKLAQIQPKLARFIYQEMLLEGGMVALPAKMDDRATAPVTVLIFGTLNQMQHLAVRLETQSDSELNLLAAELREILKPQ